MPSFSFVIRLLLAALLGVLASAAFADDTAQQQAQRQVQQPLNNAPVWREVRSGEPQFTTIRGVETNVLVQSGGQTWRALRNGPITLYGGILVCVTLVLLAAFYWRKGQIKLHGAKTGRLIERFTLAERAAHWTVAISFSVLAITGLIMLFGKHVLLPLFGYSMFAWLAGLCKGVHNFVGPIFLLSIIVFALAELRDNIPRAYDTQWLKKFGGLVSGEHVPSHRFNAGEKAWFWGGMVLLGLIVSASGLVLNFPNFEQGRTIMQQANIVHVVAALLVMCMSLAHIYLGTIGMEGAYDAMRHGYVDETWAKEHHEYWYEDVKHLAAEPRNEAQSAPTGAAAKA